MDLDLLLKAVYGAPGFGIVLFFLGLLLKYIASNFIKRIELLEEKISILNESIIELQISSCMNNSQHDALNRRFKSIEEYFKREFRPKICKGK